MSHEEPRREMLPSRLSDVTPAAALFAGPGRYDEPRRFDPPSPRPRGSAAGWIGRGLRRHWWQILPLWLAAAAGSWWLGQRYFPNTYEATSIIQVEAGDPAPGRAGGAGADFATFKETQARRVATPTVVAAALGDNPDLGRRLAAEGHTDQEGAILRGLSAAVPDRTDLIQVRMTAPEDDGLAAIVDAVVAAYLRVATDFNQANSAERSTKLRQLLRVKEDQVRSKRDEVKKLVRQHGVVDEAQGRERHAAAIGRRAALSDQLLAVDLDVVKVQKELDQARRDAAAPPAPPAAPSARPAGGTDAVARAFYRSPEVAKLQEQLVELRGQIQQAAGKPDADRRALQARADAVQVQINNLWAELEPGLRIAARDQPEPDPAPAAAAPAGEVGKLEGRLEGLKAQQAMLAERLEAMKGETVAGGSEVLNLAFARQDLERAESVLDTMAQTFNQADVASNQPVARFRQEGKAKTVEKSAAPARLAVATVVPLLALLVLLGFFGLVERQVGRILDPIDLPMRAQLDVIGLVPPLPKPRAGRVGIAAATAGARSQEDVERFIQSLDQLRVLVTGRGDAQGRPNRSLLITSASEGEGKSTLAAQLAERSVNAGLLTLLVDADLRNPSLSRMFDRPESVGLANVLRGELLAEEAIGTVAEAGGFHFLPAGLVRDDVSRLLQSEKLARFLESARESFDLVLVDSPPVLPVADALTIGRCVDAAILTVRHKASRLPLVERASRQLSSVGITILGAVVSGVRDRYAPYYGPKPASDPNRDASVGAVG